MASFSSYYPFALESEIVPVTSEIVPGFVLVVFLGRVSSISFRWVSRRGANIKWDGLN
jgi:hypothetical protein